MRQRDGKPDPASAAEDGELSDRLRELAKRLDESRIARPVDAETEARPAPPGFAAAMRLAADFVAGVVLGAALGWGFDRLLGTSPWGLVVFLLLGFAAGVLTVMRSAGLVRPGPDRSDDGARRDR